MLIPIARTLVAAGILAAGMSSSVLAQSSMSMSNGSPTSKVVHVNRCDPQLSTQVTPAYVGYAPGFYPRGGYYWGDVYGYRYAQPALSSTSATLYLDYKNVTPHVMSTIEFGLVANGRLVAEVRDVGKFSPNIEIKHEFGVSPNIFPLQTGLPQCIALRVTYSDGTKWTNPRLPSLQHAIYGPQQ